MTKKPLPKFKNLTSIILSAIILSVVAVFFLQKHQEPYTQTASQASGQIISGAFDKSKTKTDEEWKKILTSEQHHILREAGTENPFTGELNNENRMGTYYSVGCDKPFLKCQ